MEPPLTLSVDKHTIARNIHGWATESRHWDHKLLQKTREHTTLVDILTSQNEYPLTQHKLKKPRGDTNEKSQFSRFPWLDTGDSFCFCFLCCTYLSRGLENLRLAFDTTDRKKVNQNWGLMSNVVWCPFDVLLRMRSTGFVCCAKSL